MIELDQASPRSRLRLMLGSWRSSARKIDPIRSRLTPRTRALYWLNGVLQSTLNRIQKRRYADELASAVPRPPIFVLGFWRSGTTLLHELLCCDSRFGFPSTYACLNPSHFLLSEGSIRERTQRQVRRPMDDLRYSWSSPQEDEFATLLLGAPSAYEALIVPSLMRNVETLLDLSARSVEDQGRWCATFDYFLKLLTVQQGKTMVLKSPTHGYRIPILQRRFPAARFVVIERNPYEVFASNLKLWQTLTARYSLEHISPDDIEAFVLAAFLLHEKAVSDGLSHLPSGLLARVRFEDLERHPIEQMCRLYRDLELGGFETERPRMEQYLAHVSGHARNRFSLSQAQKARVDADWGHLIENKGYTWPSAYVGLDGEYATSSAAASGQSPSWVF